MTAHHPETPDGRYFNFKGKLWRLADPSLPDDKRKSLVSELMTARRATRDAKRSGDEEVEAEASRTVDAAKRAQGERGSGTKYPKIRKRFEVQAALRHRIYELRRSFIDLYVQ